VLRAELQSVRGELASVRSAGEKSQSDLKIRTEECHALQVRCVFRRSSHDPADTHDRSCG
jgi:hypothetical protein